MKLSDLPKEGDKVRYRGRLWTPNKPVPSDRAEKKRMVLAVKVVNGEKHVKLVHFGQKGYDHNYSEAVRKNYLARSAGIKGKGGEPTKDDPFSPNYWARRVLWSKKDEFDEYQELADRLYAEGRSDAYVESAIATRMNLDGKNEPTDAGLWANAIAQAKRKFRQYPSAYANLWASKRYREMFREKHGSGRSPWRTAAEAKSDDLREWLNEEWVAINSSGEIVGACGSGETRGKVRCLPKARVLSMTKEQRATLAKRKQREDPNPDRKGKAKMVSAKLK